jgi:hypothetical protein
LRNLGKHVIFRGMSHHERLAAAAFGAIFLLLAAVLWLYDSQPAVRRAIKNMWRATFLSPVLITSGALYLVNARKPAYRYKPRHAK